MATYYVDPAATGAADGSSWTDAWTTLQTAADTAAAGDTVYCRGTETLSAQIDFDTNNGSTSAFISFVGCNAAGAVDGTRYVLDGNSTATYCIYATKVRIRLDNFELKLATDHGMHASSGANRWVLNNVISHSNGGSGWTRYPNQSTYLRCIADSNTEEGFHECSSSNFYFGCSALSNGNNGFETYSVGVSFASCIAADNGVNGFGDTYGSGAYTRLVNCVADDNAASGVRVAGLSSLIGCRLTNNDYGLREYSSGADVIVCGWSFFLGNTTAGYTSYMVPLSCDADADTNETSGTEGYTDAASGDYNLTSDATLRSVAIEID